MTNVPKEHREEYRVQFVTSGNHADARAAGASLLAVDSMFVALRDDFCKTEKLLLRARPFAKGSLELPLDLIAIGAAMIFSDYPLLTAIREAVAKYFSLKQELKGEQPRIKNNRLLIGNRLVYIEQIHQHFLNPNSEVSRQYSQAFEYIDQDRSIDRVRILSNAQSEPIADIPRQHFSYFQTPEQQVKYELVQSREILGIRQAAFDPELSWRFMFGQHSINAKILDGEFLRRVSAGSEVFSFGDALDVDLTRQEQCKPVVEGIAQAKGYTITKVHEHHRRDNQQRAF